MGEMFIWTSDSVDESILNDSSDDNLNNQNRNQYISEISNHLDKYLLEGTAYFQSEEIADLFKLTEKELNILKSIHFLLNDDVKKLFKCIPYLLRNLAHSTNKEDIEYYGIIRGSINWNKTIKTRYSKGFNDPGLFVCSPPLKHYDLTENRILKFILKKIIFLFEKDLAFIKPKNFNINFENLDKEYKNWYNQVGDIYKLSVHTLRNVYFNDISDLEDVSAADLNKLFNHRNNLYHIVANVFELYENLFINEENNDCLKNLIQNQLIVASSNNTLFEIYVFFQLVSTLYENCIEDSFKMGLFYKNNNNPVEADLNDGLSVKVYYQNVPDIFRDDSLYISINGNKEFNFPTGIRRPDLIVEVIKDQKSYHRIIEVKNSSRPDYMANSFYKVLGYYKDFEKVPFVENIPIVVVNWNGSSIDIQQKEKIFKEKIIFFNKDEFIENRTLLLDF